jgi:hypothetical protein
VALSLSPNLKFDLYAGFDPGASIPDPAVQGPVWTQHPGYLKSQLPVGRFGYQTKWLYYTHQLLLDPDLLPQKDAYDTQLDPARNNASSATVVIKDWPIPGKTTAFYVVMVHRYARGLPGEYIALYLDKAQTADSTCIPPPCKLDPNSTLHAQLNVTSGPTQWWNALVVQLHFNQTMQQWEGLLTDVLNSMKVEFVGACPNLWSVQLTCYDNVHGTTDGQFFPPKRPDSCFPFQWASLQTLIPQGPPCIASNPVSNVLMQIVITQ